MEQGIEIRAVRHPSGRSVIPDDAEFVGDFIEAFPPDTVFTMSLKKYRKRRSKGAPDEDGNQLGYFFGIVVPKWQNEILHCLKKEEAYYFPLNEYSYELVPSPKGKPIKRHIHANEEMRVDKMTELIDKSIMGAAEHGVYIPDPDPRKSKRHRARMIANGQLNQMGVAA